MILVDRPIWPAHGRRFAHLVSDESYDELHAFAAALGLPPRAFHRDHYDLPAEWWDEAVAAGATEVDARELVRRLRASGLRRRAPRPAGHPQPGSARSTRSARAGRMTPMDESDDADVGRAPICPACGVTALPADTSNVLDSAFVCENPDCDAYGDAVES